LLKFDLAASQTATRHFNLIFLQQPNEDLVTKLVQAVVPPVDLAFFGFVELAVEQMPVTFQAPSGQA